MLPILLARDAWQDQTNERKILNIAGATSQRQGGIAPGGFVHSSLSRQVLLSRLSPLLILPFLVGLLLGLGLTRRN